MKRVIGLIPLVDDGRDSLWMLPGYMDGVTAAGGLPVMLPLTDDEDMLKQLCGLCDGFLLTGGHDVSPEFYGRRRLPECGATCPRRDRMEAAVLRLAMERDKPVLGICRGIQFVNAALGGTLWQDLPTQHPSGVVHQQRPPYDVPSHDVDILPDTPPRRPAGSGLPFSQQLSPPGYPRPLCVAAAHGLGPRRAGRSRVASRASLPVGGPVAPRIRLEERPGGAEDLRGVRGGVRITRMWIDRGVRRKWGFIDEEPGIRNQELENAATARLPLFLIPNS